MSGPPDEVAAGPRRFVLRLVLVAVALRGVGYALLTPTYEGWDEYQHLAYFEHLRTNGRPPSLGESFVPQRIFDDLVKEPAPEALKSQAPDVGLRTYAEYWIEPPVRAARGRAVLYEAQHSIGYYRLQTLIYDPLANHPFLAVRALRLANLGWTLLGVWLVAVILRRAEVDQRLSECALILLSVQPLFLMSNVRVANDAMAFALGAACIVAALRLQSHTSNPDVGGFLGVVGLVKATAWTQAPATLVLRVRRPRGLSHALRTSLFFALTLGVALTLEFMRQGRFAPTQEAWVLAEQGKGLGDVWRAALSTQWFDEFARRWGRQMLWVGGWSFAPLPKILPRLHQWILIASLVPLAIRLWRRELRDWNFAAFCVLACLGVAAGQALHMAQSKAALGFVATPAWYAVIALPWLLAGLVWSWGIYERLPSAATTAFFALLLSAEVVGVFFNWLPTFADSADLAVVVDRCSRLAGGKPLFVLGCAAFVVGWAAATAALTKALRRGTA